MEAMVSGMLALTLAIGSLGCLCYKKPVPGLVSSIVTMILACLAGYAWREMLIDSGKDSALLGFYRYPAVLTMLVILFLAAFAVMIVSVIWIVKWSKKAK